MDPCVVCGGAIRLRYPGNDPENGPADLLCPEEHVQDTVAEMMETLTDLRDRWLALTDEERERTEECEYCRDSRASRRLCPECGGEPQPAGPIVEILLKYGEIATHKSWEYVYSRAADQRWIDEWQYMEAQEEPEVAPTISGSWLERVVEAQVVAHDLETVRDQWAALDRPRGAGERSPEWIRTAERFEALGRQLRRLIEIPEIEEWHQRGQDVPCMACGRNGCSGRCII